MSNFVNKTQSKEERQKKYKYVRSKGFEPFIAQRLRDFTNNHIEQFIKVNGRLIKK